jgi:hypothetical protein
MYYALVVWLVGVLVAVVLLLRWCIPKLFQQGATHKRKGVIGLCVCVAVVWLHLDTFEFVLAVAITYLAHL